MLIHCPNCPSTYNLPNTLLGAARRTLRCAHCRECWTVSGDVEGRNNVFALFDADHGPEIVAEARSGRQLASIKASPKAHRRAPIAGSLRRSWRNAATVATSFIVVACAMAGLARKDDVVRLVPPSAALFDALGLPVNLRGLALANIHGTMQADDEGKGPVLTLEGKIRNLRAASTEVPRLRFTVRDKTRNVLYSWTAAAPKPKLDVGETVVFKSRLATPPQDGRDLVVSFADPSEVPRARAEHQ